MRFEKVSTAAGEIAVVRPEAGDEGGAYLRAEIGSLAGLAAKSVFIYSALAGNFFYRDTDGAVISLDDANERAYLTERCDDAALDSESARAALVNDFASVLRVWRERLESGKTAAGKEA